MSYYTRLIGIFLVGVVVAAGIFSFVVRSSSQAGETEGVVYVNTPKAKLITIQTKKDGLVSLDLSGNNFSFIDDSNSRFSVDELRRGFVVRASGAWTDKKTLRVSNLHLVTVPNISVFTPTEGETVGIPLVGSGEARVFENAYQYRLRDSDGSILGEGFDTANAPDVGKFGPFSFSLFYPAPKGATGMLEVFTSSAKDGSEIDMVRVPVVFEKGLSEENDMVSISLFFTNSEKDPGAKECEKTYPVTRRISKTPTPARSAIDLLLAGPTSAEKIDGFGTSINEGTLLKGIKIEGGVATVDFDKTLMDKVGGSCRVGAIRSQIENTLKQFSTIKEVIVSVGGKTEGVLEP